MFIVDEPIEAGAIVRERTPHSCGAQVVFAGVVRDHNEGRAVRGIYYDCYRDMAEREIACIIDEVRTELDVADVKVVHRVGELAVGEASLLVVAWSAHRSAAFQAVTRIVDEIKRRVPIWKKERYCDAGESWL